MATRWARVIRGLVAAGVATFVAALFHTVAGGSPPGPLGVVVTMIVALPAATILAGKAPSWTRLALSVAGSQFLFHLTLGLASRPGLSSAAGHGGHGPTTGSATILDLGGAASVGAVGTGVTMWPAHLLAALVTVVVLGHGEAAFWALLALTGFGSAVALAAAPTPPPPPGRRTRADPRRELPLPASLAALSPMRRRGPPLACA